MTDRATPEFIASLEQQLAKSADLHTQEIGATQQEVWQLEEELEELRANLLRAEDAYCRELEKVDARFAWLADAWEDYKKLQGEKETRDWHGTNLERARARRMALDMARLVLGLLDEEE